MFTGLIQELGTIQSIRPNAEGKEFILKLQVSLKTFRSMIPWPLMECA